MEHSDATFYLDQFGQCRKSIRRLLPPIYDPEDVFQDVWVVAARGNLYPHELRSQAAWLRTSARNIAVGRHRQESVRQCPTLSADPPNNEAREPIAELEKVEGQAMVREAVESLKPAYRHVIERRFFADESHSEIASDLGIPEQTVRTRYKRAIKQLKRNPQLAELARFQCEGQIV